MLLKFSDAQNKKAIFGYSMTMNFDNDNLFVQKNINK